MINPFKYVYGPVYSWRLGRSLGVDPLSLSSKVCNMDCIYCQLGRTTHLSHECRDYVITEDVIHEINQIPQHLVDYITFSGRGEPTLARNLGEMICAVKQIRHEKVAVITNGLLLGHDEVIRNLSKADFVLIKLDAGNQHDFETIDGMNADFNKLVEGIIKFRLVYTGKMALQVMLIDQNIHQAESIAKVARSINPDEVQLNTPLRPSGVNPISRSQMEGAKRFFHGMSVVTVFDSPIPNYVPIDEPATVSRHGNYRKTRSSI